MAVERIVRITQTWDVKVTAEYGDTDADLVKKAQPGKPSEAAETRNLIPED